MPASAAIAAVVALAVGGGATAPTPRAVDAPGRPVPRSARARGEDRGEGPASAEPLPFAPGEQIDLVIDYLHVRSGSARLLVGRAEGAVWPVICQARTDGLASILDIREHYVAYWDAARRRSRGSDLNAIEVGDRHTDRSRFDRENGKAYVEVLRKGRARESTVDVPRDVEDLAGALLALRLRALRPGDRYELPVFSGTRVSTLRAAVEGEELVETPAGRFETRRVAVQLGLDDRFRTARAAQVWFSSDPRHIPVRMRADFAVGAVEVTVSAYRPGGQVAASR